MGATADIAAWIARTDDPPTPRAMRAAEHAVLDWAGVTLAACGDPLVELLVADAERGPSAVAGRPERLAPTAAARVMGAASHALDFDDINKRMRGHPSVAILPALLAAGDGDLADALVAGTEVAAILGEMLGPAHYEHGFHTTATVGTVAAAAAVCRLRGANHDTTARALSLAATQASGLRATFGTMAKPLHAGFAAERGLRAAKWAIAGMSAPMDGIEHPQGFGPVLSAEFAARPIRPDATAAFAIEENVFKHHAACYYAHSAMEAARRLGTEVDVQDITGVTIGLQEPLLTVCDIVAPKTGLEVKFSVRHLVAMTLLGWDTTAPAAFTDALAADPEISSLSRRITVKPLETTNRMEAAIRIERGQDPRLEMRCDVSAPAQDLDEQEAALIAKFARLTSPLLGNQTDAVAQVLLSAESAASVLAALSTRS
ncbi:MmgE/PrpD family protein [Ruegeria sp. HKCCD4884]|uniref:MmgE/PrpD family protein n=1 Tax=Ruegeria sp. HKCCD4884 TaxID=2683022 RepID=UPI001492E389|nr:MmgE/PrpD family protein [Ruegeria sp. HKCCD4884]NOD95293.1 MmgE/PrpD family protein [Ruegeria sp. HKCCD4884]